MTTIKSYTDIEQSKKLAEILPLESTDMCYPYDRYLNKMYGDIPYVIGYKRFNGDTDIPCWSLAALFDALPKNLNIGRPSLNSNYMGYYWIQYYDEFMKPNRYKTECLNNPIDVCYEMILKLNELNLL